MRKKLKFKVLAGFMLLAGLLITAGVISITEFTRLSGSVTALIEDNYKTIEASKSMLEALEREDSGILHLLLGHLEDGRQVLLAADNSFNESFTIAANNITEQNEEEILDEIKINYDKYKSIWKRPIVDTYKQGNISWFQNDIHKAFTNAKMSVNSLMSLNQNSMHEEASLLKDKAHRAIMPGIIAIISALVFSVLLNYFITKFFIIPLRNLEQAINSYLPGDRILKSDLKSNDELKTLEISIKRLLEKVDRS